MVMGECKVVVDCKVEWTKKWPEKKGSISQSIWETFPLYFLFLSATMTLSS
jgi:hypothetical protein